MCRKSDIIEAIETILRMCGDNMKVRNELNYQLFLQKTSGIHRKPMNAEMEHYDDICNGDIDAVRENINNLTEFLSRQLSDNPVQNARYHLTIMASAIAKACIQSGMGHDEAYTLADIYIRKADKCQIYEGIVELLQELQFDFTERMQEIRKEHVISLHVRKCIDYIYEHLGDDLTVNSLAEYCGLHPSYLSRLFYSETGTHLKAFVLDAKIDTAQNLLKYSDLSYLDISVALGFSSQSSFIYVFRKITGTTPKKFREQNYVTEQ